MQDDTAKHLDVMRERHLFVPLSDSEMKKIATIKQTTGKAKSFFIREAIIEKLEREASA